MAIDASHDTIEGAGERATEGLSFRTEPIAAHERTVLAAVDHATFFNALDNPSQAKPKLREALARNQKRVLSR